MRRVPLLATLTVLLLAAGTLTACSPSGEKAEISAHAEGIELTLSEPPKPDSDTTAAIAVEAALSVAPSEYLMLRPLEITASEPIPATGVDLAVTLPSKLPSGAVGTFAYFDETADAWMPVPTDVAGREATATVDHLSLWTFVITGAPDVIGDIAAGFEEVGAGIVTLAEDAGDALTDGLAWWSTEGPGDWIYRQGGLLLGIQVEEPDCGPTGPLPAWVEATDISVLTDYAESHYAVLRCIGVDPDDPDRVLVTAAMNRGYGFTVDFAAGVEPADLSWSAYADLVGLDVDAIAQLLASTGPVQGFLNPRNTLIGTSDLSFTVGESEVRAIPEGVPLVQFTQAAPLEAVLSVVYRMVLGMVEDSAGALVGTVLALRDCDPADLTAESDTALWAGWVVSCLQAVGDEDFQKGIDEVTSRASEEGSTWPPAVEKLWTKDGTKILRKSLSALKWIDVVILGLTLVDYLGDDDPYWVDVIPVAKAASLADSDGAWCFAGGECFSISQLRTSYGEVIEFTEMHGECFYGYAAIPDYPGANFMYCPAGAATPSNEAPLFEADNPAFDRIWFWQGYGAPTAYRESELAAATGT